MITDKFQNKTSRLAIVALFTALVSVGAFIKIPIAYIRTNPTIDAKKYLLMLGVPLSEIYPTAYDAKMKEMIYPNVGMST